MQIICTIVFLLGLVRFSWQQCPQDFAQKVLDRHNEYRARHGVPLLTIAAQITPVAQEWADHLLANDLFEHRPDNQFGENLFAESGNTGPPNPNSPVDSWYNEISKYTFFGQEPNMSTFEEWGHFTQLVWKASLEIGVGCATRVQSGSRRTVVVVNYNPAGNAVGSFKDNVLPVANNGSTTPTPTTTNDQGATFGSLPTNVPTGTMPPTNGPTAPTTTDDPGSTFGSMPTNVPTGTMSPTNGPTTEPTDVSTVKPTDKPTDKPTEKPTPKPTKRPTYKPTYKPPYYDNSYGSLYDSSYNSGSYGSGSHDHDSYGSQGYGASYSRPNSNPYIPSHANHVFHNVFAINQYHKQNKKA